MRRLGKVSVCVFLGALVACEKSPDPAAIAAPAASGSAASPSSPSSAASVAAAPALPTKGRDEAPAGGAPSSAPQALPRAEAADAAAATDAAPGSGQAGTVKTDVVKLLSAGKAPLAKLRYRFVKDRTERLQMITRSDLSMSIAGKTMPAPSAPGIKVVAALTVLSVDAKGGANRRLALETVSLLPGPGLDVDSRRRAEANLEQMEKLTGKDKVDARGFVQSVELDASKVESPEMRQALGAMQQTFDQMGAPFPEQDVGLGGKWQVKTRVDQMGIRLEQVAVYELTAFEGEQGKIKVQIKQSAPRGKMKLPGLPAGASAELVGMKGTGAGELAFQLSRGIPDGSIDTDTEVDVRVMLGTEEQQMSTRLKAKVTFKPLTAQ